MDDSLQDKLRPLRDRIDAIDAQILDLLSQRAHRAGSGLRQHAAHAMMARCCAPSAKPK